MTRRRIASCSAFTKDLFKASTFPRRRRTSSPWASRQGFGSLPHSTACRSACSVRMVSLASTLTRRLKSSSLTVCSSKDPICRLLDAMRCCKHCIVSSRLVDSSTISSSFSGGGGCISCFSVGPYAMGSGCEVRASNTAARNFSVDAPEAGGAGGDGASGAFCADGPAGGEAPAQPCWPLSLSPPLHKASCFSNRASRREKLPSKASASSVSTCFRTRDGAPKIPSSSASDSIDPFTASLCKFLLATHCSFLWSLKSMLACPASMTFFTLPT
mmetsp:Transcript_65614/g.129038  ORF Transcript_65614/g.129038 Transcript_65614/m.129038 type:complete len:272 (-) Transcript_65614:321-1136(-)